MVEPVGRGDEAAALERLLESSAAGLSCLVWVGEPGIGKSALWQATLDAANTAGFRVLATRPTEAEAELSHVSLTDLFGSVDAGLVAALPDPQRRALDIALLRSDADDAGVDARALGMATHAVLAALAREGPVLLAIDDVQWVDLPTARAIAFAVRRLAQDPIGLVLTRRTPPLDDVRAAIEQSVPAAAADVRPLGPLTLGALHRLVAQTGVDLARPALVHLERASGGNPLLALDIVGALRRAGQPLTADMILPVPQTVERLVRDRIEPLPALTRRLVVTASALARADLATLEVLERDVDIGAGLRPAIECGLLEMEGPLVRFVHPLYRSAVYTSQSDTARRALHRRLATAVSSAEESAMHTALGATPPDAAAARSIARVADDVFRRGGLDTSAALFEHAIRLTPQDERDFRASTTVALARILWELGDLTASRALVDDALRLDVAGAVRTETLLLHAVHTMWSDGAERAIPIYLAALPTAAGSVELEATVHLRIAYAADHDLTMAASHARTAVGLLERTNRADALLAAALLLTAELEHLTGGPYDEAAVARGRALLERAAAAERAGTSFDAHAVARERSWILRVLTDDVPMARVELEAIRRDDLERGRDRALPIALADLTELCTWMGDLPAARTYADDASQMVAQTGRTPYPEAATAFAASLVAEYAGDWQAADELARRALEVADPLGPGPLTDRIHVVLGRLALNADRPRQAIERFRVVDERLAACGARNPLLYRCAGDHIEALVRAGEERAADALLTRFTVGVDRATSPWGLAIGARSRALLAASRGDLADAEEALDQAIVVHEALPMPIELGRTLLQLGGVRRRRRRKRLASEALERGRAVFAAAGAAGWARVADRELARLGERPSSADALTATEWEVARLAATGMTNRQVADAMVLSPKSIDGALTRIYGKLGIHSRAELGARIAREIGTHREG